MIGVVGLGAIGYGVASTLLRRGYDVTVYDIDATRAAHLEVMGAVVAEDVSSLAGSCDPILLGLPESEVAVEVIENEIGPAAGEGTTIIDLGTTLIGEAQRLHAALKARAISLVDAPAIGGPLGSTMGALVLFVGGDRDPVDRNWTLLSHIGGARLTYCGGSGSGQITKAVVELSLGLVSAAHTEAVAYGVACGMDASVLLDALDSTIEVGGRHESNVEDGGPRKRDYVNRRIAEYGYFLDEADRRSFDAPMLRALSSYIEDNSNGTEKPNDRPNEPLWSRLVGSGG